MALLGTLLVKLAADASGVRQGVGEAQKELKKVQSEAQETRDVLRKAFGAEVFATQATATAASFAKLEGSFGKVASAGLAAAGQLVQGWGQGGPIGIAIAGVAIGVRALVDHFAAAEEAARRAAEEAAIQHRKVSDAVATETKALEQNLKLLQAIAMARGSGVDEAAALRTLTREELELRLKGAQAEETRARAMIAADKAAREAYQGERAAEYREGRRRFGMFAAEPADLTYNFDQQGGGQYGRSGILSQPAQAAAQGAIGDMQERARLIREQLKALDAEGKVVEERKKLAAAEKAREQARDDRRRLWESQGTGYQQYMSDQRAKEAAAWDAETEDFFDQLDSDALNAASVEARRLADAEQAAVEASIASEAQMRSMAQAAEMAAVSFDEASSGFSLGGSGERYFSSASNFGLQTTMSAQQGMNIAGDSGLLGGNVGAVVGGAAQGGILGAGLALVSQSKQMRGVVAHLSEFLQRVSDTLGKLIEPFMPFIAIVTKLAEGVLPLIADAVGFLEPAFLLVFNAVKYLAGALNVAAVAITWPIQKAMDFLTEKIADFVEALPGEDWSRDAVRELRAMVEGPQKGFVESIEDAWAITDLQYGDLIDSMIDLGSAVDSVTGSMVNLPAIFKLDRARLDASNSSAADSGYQTGTFGYTSAGGYGGGMGSTYIFEGDVYVTADDPAEMWRQIAEVSQFRNVRTSGQRYDRTPRYAVLEGTAPA